MGLRFMFRVHQTQMIGFESVIGLRFKYQYTTPKPYPLNLCKKFPNP